jgi:CDP-glucose 4,6-dehydratase
VVDAFLTHWPGEWRDESSASAPHEASLLHLATDKAASVLRWFPVWDFADAVRESAAWYHARHVGGVADMRAVSVEQIARFTHAAADRQLDWTAPA